MSGIILKTKRGEVEFSWSDDDLAIDAENSDERVQLFLDALQARELFEYLQKKFNLTTPAPIAAREDEGI